MGAIPRTIGTSDESLADDEGRRCVTTAARRGVLEEDAQGVTTRSEVRRRERDEDHLSAVRLHRRPSDDRDRTVSEGAPLFGKDLGSNFERSLSVLWPEVV